MAETESFKSRKMVMSYVTIILITAAFLASGWRPNLTPALPEFYMAVIAATGVYVGGNITGKYVALRHGPSVPKNRRATDPKPPKP
jgi:hypothetical protein